MKVHIYPSFRNADEGDGGIRRVVENQITSLPATGIEIVDDPAVADLIASHITYPMPWARLYPRTPVIAMNHGAYWAEYQWPGWPLKANADVFEACRHADAITAPTEWVAQILRRHLSRPVEVIPHGVNLEEWTPIEHTGAPYVVWNKTRPDPVCDPEPMNQVAALMPEVMFVSTFGKETRNVGIVGRKPYEEGKRLVQMAGVYLCTTKETFGIGTLEALAAGVPVVGFDYGGQSEIIEHGKDGWLVPPGDINGLADGIRWALANRSEITPAAQAKAAKYTWQNAAEMYHSLFERTLNRRRQWFPENTSAGRPPKVSVVVTAYKLEDYLPDTLDSVLRQTSDDWECLVVDDASPDRCGEIADRYAAKDARFKVIHNRTNQYLAGARNTAIRQARGEYILPLDADDMIAPETLVNLATALDQDRTIHIAYGNVRFFEADGKTPSDYSSWNPNLEKGRSGWPLPFVYENQAKGMNYLPYCSMYRREVWEYTGGYRTRNRTAEDADFWLRVSSYGFQPKMVTEADTLLYRNRPGSMSREQGGRQWNRWYPWAADINLAPAGAVTREQLPIPAYDPPDISVIIPVGPGHEEIVADAVDSLDAQSFRNWECIVINDSGGELAALPAWVRIVKTRGRIGVAAARNAGLRKARGHHFLPLDADDLLEPDALSWLAETAKNFPGQIIYPDFWENPDRGEATYDPLKFTLYKTPDYDPSLLTRNGALHPVTALTPIDAWKKIGGYDESLACWEDWAFQLAAVDNGICSRRLAAPLFTYRKDKGARREANQVDFDRCKEAILERFAYFWDGRRPIMGCGCSAGSSVQPSLSQHLYTHGGDAVAGALAVQYTGLRQGGVTIRGSKAAYTFAANEPARWVHLDDVHIFERKPNDFKIIRETAAAPENVPTPILVAEGPPARAAAPPDAGMNAMSALAGMNLNIGPAVLDNGEHALPPVQEGTATIATVDRDAVIHGLMELGLPREAAEKRADEVRASE